MSGLRRLGVNQLKLKCFYARNIKTKLTNYMECIPTGEAKSHSANQEILPLT